MSFVNYDSEEKIFKVVYWGASLAGKTENLKHIYATARADKRGELITLATETERTAYFEFLAISLGTLGSFKVRLHLFTVPGADGYDASRLLILKGADAVVFVADSDPVHAAETQASHRALLLALRERLPQARVPVVYQHNKTDKEPTSQGFRHNIGDVESELSPISAQASEGRGVFETLREVAGRLL